MGLKIITAPAAEPVSLAELKAHLNIDADIVRYDAALEIYLKAARAAAEQKTGRALMPQVLELALDAFEPVIWLARPPIATVQSITYLDNLGAEQILAPAEYVLDSYSEPGRLAAINAWPQTKEQFNAVKIRYSAGYETAEQVPADIKQWIKMLVGLMFANRESAAAVQLSEVPYADSLINPYVIHAYAIRG